MLLYNTLTKGIERFVPIKKGHVGMYCCGPTVYDFAHIGNLRTYICEDLLKRTLKYDGYEVTHVMNITDVGHLTSDADTGLDKIEKSAEEQKKSAWEISKMYTDFFLQDIKKLNIESPTILCKATDNINEMIILVKRLEEKGFTYRIDDGIYYDTSKFKDYGKLAGMSFDELNKSLKAGARVEFNPQKRNITDFALWKFSPKDKKRQMEWPSPWGVGFPGWHIECSAMSMKYLGEHFDIHCGGVDHIPIHHTNEIAQSEGATGKKFVNYWFHVEFLLVNGRKMSKSLKNFYTLRDLEKMGFDPLSFRLMVIDSHYRDKIDFTLEKLKKYEKTLNDIDISIKTMDILPLKEEKRDDLRAIEKSFKKAINDDLDTHSALIELFKVIGIINSHIKKYSISKENRDKIHELIKKMNSVFGVLQDYSIPEEVLDLAKRRASARERKDWKESDELRRKIKESGFDIIDVKDAYVIVKHRNFGETNGKSIDIGHNTDKE